MRRQLYGLIVLAAILLNAGTAAAEDLKVGVVDFQGVFQAYEGYEVYAAYEAYAA